MKIKVFLFTVIFLLGTGLGINAQIIDGYVKSKARTAKNRAVYDADKEVDNQINTAVDKQFNKMKDKALKKDEKPAEGDAESSESGNESDSDSKSNSSGKSSSDDAMSKAIMGKMGINMTRPANMKDVYDFTGNIKMDIEVWNSDGESDGPVDYITHYSDKNHGFAMEFKDKDKGKSLMIFDYDNQLMLIMADNGHDKSGIATPLGAYQYDSVKYAGNSTQPDADSYNAKFKKTGKSKTIAGYKCDEYLYEDEENTVSYWTTTELPAELWAKMYSSNALNSVYTGQYSGFTMESDRMSKTSKERSHMIVKEVNPKQPASISTVGYNVMTMSGPQASPEKSGKEEKGDKK